MTAPSRLVQSARRLVAPVRPLLYRRRPFSVWGLERGTPVDRVYIEDFLSRHRQDIHGRVLEVKDRAYTERFGTGVEQADVVDVDQENGLATIVGRPVTQARFFLGKLPGLQSVAIKEEPLALPLMPLLDKRITFHYRVESSAPSAAAAAQGAPASPSPKPSP